MTNEFTTEMPANRPNMSNGMDFIPRLTSAGFNSCGAVSTSNWDGDDSFRSRSKSFESAASLGVFHDLCRLHDVPQPEAQEDRDGSEPLYFLNCFTRSTPVGGGLLKVTCTFKWIPKCGASRVLHWLPIFDHTVAKYSFAIGKQQYRAYKSDGRAIMGWSEFRHFHTLVEQHGPNSKGLTWTEAMTSTAVAKNHADALASRDKSSRRDTQSRTGKIYFNGTKTRYPQQCADDEW